jgi:hypothetical protein
VTGLRRRPAVAVVALVVLIAGCGAETTSKPLPAALPPPAPVTPSMAATGTDPSGDGAEPAADIVSANLSQESGELVARIEMAAVPQPVAGTLEVGAYLLSSEQDDNPAALRATITASGEPHFSIGPWLESGTPVTGAITGTTIEIRGGTIEQGKWRYVQFYAASDAGDDVLPDVSDKADDMIPITGTTTAP